MSFTHNPTYINTYRVEKIKETFDNALTRTYAIADYYLLSEQFHEFSTVSCGLSHNSESFSSLRYDGGKNGLAGRIQSSYRRC